MKGAYQPVRPQDIPATFMRACATAVQPPADPVLLSLPLDDWGPPLLHVADAVGVNVSELLAGRRWLLVGELGSPGFGADSPDDGEG